MKNLCLLHPNYILRSSLLRHGIWDQVRVDGGKEFSLICHIQEHLQSFRTNVSRKPYYKSKSTDVSILSLFLCFHYFTA